MKTLHVFGDSFAATKKAVWPGKEGPRSSDNRFTHEEVATGIAPRNWDKNNPLDYKEHLSLMLDCDVISDSPWTAIMGCSDEYTLRTMSQYVTNIKPQDIVVYVTTDPTREYVLPGIPNHGNISNFHIKRFRECILQRYPASEQPKIQKEIEVAIDYADYIQSDESKRECLAITYQARMAWLKQTLSQLAPKSIILPGMCFSEQGSNALKTGFATTDILGWDFAPGGNNIHNNDIRVRGCLGHISYWEMEDPNLYNTIMNHPKCWNGLDRRANHLIPDNHKILAQKIYNSIEKQVDLDLTIGFVTQVLNPKNCNDEKYTTPDHLVEPPP